MVELGGACPWPHIDIIRVTTGGYHSLGLHNDGAVCREGLNAQGQCDVWLWDLDS